MKKNFPYLLLPLFLCAFLSGTARAAETRSVTVNRQAVEPGYYMCAVWDGDTLLVMQDTEVKEDGVLHEVIDIGDTSASGNMVQVSISNINSTSPQPLVLPEVPIEVSGGPVSPSTPPSSPGTPNRPSAPSSSDRSESKDKTYTISVPSVVTGGTVTVKPRPASKGDTVTITITPNPEYQLDTLVVVNRKGDEIQLTDEGDGKYTFTMPASKVTIYASFLRIQQKTSDIYTDVAKDYWAKDAIDWASANGYMKGTGNDMFSPERTITRQQLWMVLGRLSGKNPINMKAAQEWAVQNHISDGSNPGNSVTRQQMVTILYRYAQMTEYPFDGTSDISSYPDCGSVAGYAETAVTWAVANGIIAGTLNGQLNPAGSTTRAQFVVILQRYCKNISSL